MESLLLKKRLEQGPICKMIVIDDFYDNPMDVRKFALEQTFVAHEFHPGKRTDKQFYTIDHCDKFKAIFDCIDCIPDGGCNGTFQYNIANDLSWIHADGSDVPAGYEPWAGIIYLTPNAPASAGTGFYRYHDGSMERNEAIYLQNDYVEHARNCHDNSKWQQVSGIGNCYNRLVLFQSDQFHMSLDYFGKDIHDGRLIQLFFLGVKFKSDD